jgi:tetratricopeptide (TPR) repeat protein
MNRLRLILALTVISLVTLAPTAGRALDVQSLSQQAQQAASAGQTTQALGLYELALSQYTNQPDSVSGPLIGQYWQLIGRTQDFPRARDFFTALLSQQQKPSATLLASEASATGSYIGWLYQNKLAAGLPAETLQKMDASARNNYSRALALEPDNFSALYGYAIYESYNPNGKAHMQELLTKLNSLRSSHPHYPWQMVDYLEQHGHPQF